MDLDGIASIATASGVVVAAWQIRESRKLASASFEDSYDQQYRELIYKIPVDVLLGKDLVGNNNEAREAIYNYLDLCNEQVYQRSKKRISKGRWKEWASGIKENIERPFISEVWSEIKSYAPGSLSFLESLEQSKFKDDPIKWRKTWLLQG